MHEILGMVLRAVVHRADMSHKLASYQLWSQDSTTAAMGGFMGREDPKAPRMMSDGSVSKTSASQLGELTQAAHVSVTRRCYFLPYVYLFSGLMHNSEHTTTKSSITR